MRFSTWLLLFSLSLALGLYWYQATAALCPVPLSYRVGDIDPSFTITKAEALQRVAAAEAVWEAEADRELFVYDESAAFTIDFVFDERQETLDTEATERRVLDERRAANERVMSTVDSLQRDYENLRQQYESQVEMYEADLRSYNQTVQRYNDQGGAPAEVFEELESERTALEATADQLSETSAELNSLATEITTLGERGNAEVAAYNRDVERYNNRYGYVREFTQGDYQGDAIHIYTFTSDAELETVLAHEFGHALGIGHVEDSAALMYYLMEDPHSGPSLSDADREAFVSVCGEAETFGQNVRHQIRQLVLRG